MTSLARYRKFKDHASVMAELNRCLTSRHPSLDTETMIFVHGSSDIFNAAVLHIESRLICYPYDHFTLKQTRDSTSVKMYQVKTRQPESGTHTITIATYPVLLQKRDRFDFAFLLVEQLPPVTDIANRLKATIKDRNKTGRIGGIE